MRSQGMRRFKVEVQITATCWAEYRSQDHGKFMLEGTSGALYPVHPAHIQTEFLFLILFYGYYLSSSHQALSCAKHDFISLMNLWALGATFWYLPSCLLSRMSQCSACPHILTGQVLPPRASWWPSAEFPPVHWCLPLAAFQR